MSESLQFEFAGHRRPQKSEAAFRTISEVSEDLDVPQHVLRFWESRFPTIKPLKRGGGRRYYRPEDVQLLRRIRDLLYKDGYTIRGVQKLLREPWRGEGPEPALAPAPAAAASTPLPAAPAPRPVVTEPVLTPPPVTVKPAPAAHPVQAAAPALNPSLAPGPIGITGARRALLETLVAEIDELRGQLGEALKKGK